MTSHVASTLCGLFLVGSALSVLLCLYAAAKRKETPIAGSFAWLMAAIAVYCFGLAFEITGGTLPRILFWVKIEYFGIATLPSLWVIMAYDYAIGGRHKKPWAVAGLFVIPAISIALVWTNELLHFLYAAVSLTTSGPFPVLVISRGPWYYVLITNEYVCLLGGIAFFVRTLIRSAPSTRPQAAIFLVIALIPATSNVLYLAGATPYGIDLSPLAFVITGLLVALNIFRFHFLDVVPVALGAVFRAIGEGVVILDRNGKVIDFNERARAVLCARGQPRVGATLRECLTEHPDLVTVLERPSGETNDVPITVDGEIRWFDVRVSPVLTQRGQAVGRTIILVDTTERALLLEQARRLAITDELTGLPNRRHFMERARQELERAARGAKPVSAIVVDLDHFKCINDTYGHAMGDAVLRSVAATWREGLRSFDLLGRCGGEEFAVILPETALPTAIAIAERMRRDTEALPVTSAAVTIHPTASFGVACSEGTATTDLEALLALADKALYAAKDAGRNRVRSADSGGHERSGSP